VAGFSELFEILSATIILSFLIRVIPVLSFATPKANHQHPADCGHQQMLYIWPRLD